MKDLFNRLLGRNKAPFDIQQAIEFVRGKILEVEIKGQPFTHAQLPQVLPPEVYTGVEEYWPDMSLFAREEKRNNHYYIKSQDSINNQGILSLVKRMPREQAAFWRAASPVLDAVNAALAERWHDGLAARFGDDYQSWMGFNGRWNLMVDMEGEDYSIHVDAPPIAVAAILYVPMSKEQSQQGTVLYRCKDEDHRSCGAKFYSSKEEVAQFEEVSRAPFDSNAMFTFLNNAKAFHGVDALSGEGTVRRSILFRYWINPDSFDKVFGENAYANIRTRTPELEQSFIDSMRKVETWPTECAN